MRFNKQIVSGLTLLTSVPMAVASASGPPVPPCSFSVTAVAGLGTFYFGRVNTAVGSQGAIAGSNAGCARQAFITAGFLAGYSAGTDNLESHSLGLSFAGTSVTGAITGSGNDGGFESTLGPPGNNGRYATSGSWSYYDDGTFQLTTSPGVNGFGFYTTDVGDKALSNLRITYEDARSNGTDYTYTMAGNGLFTSPYANGDLAFLGLILDSPYTLSEVDFNANGPLGIGGDTPGFDDFTVLVDPPGQELAVTPEPATMGLLATGLIGMAGPMLRRRRRSKA